MSQEYWNYSDLFFKFRLCAVEMFGQYIDEVLKLLRADQRHCEYQSLTNLHVEPATHGKVHGAVAPPPPHCP